MDKYHMPQHLDLPFKILIWTADEALALIVPFLLVLAIFNAPLTGIMLGAALMMGLKKIKGDEGHSFLLHLAYWYLPETVRYKVVPPSCFREILG